MERHICQSVSQSERRGPLSPNPNGRRLHSMQVLLCSLCIAQRCTAEECEGLGLGCTGKAKCSSMGMGAQPGREFFFNLHKGAIDSRILLSCSRSCRVNTSRG